MKAACKSEEVQFWDQWNTKARTTAFTVENTYIGRIGILATNEVRRLDLQMPSLLEIGCGTGWLASELSGIGSYLGLDLSPEAVEVASKRVPSARFVVADFHSWQPEGAPFDVVVMVDTIAYFRDQDAAVRRVCSLLKPGGSFVLTTVNPTVYSRMSWVGAPGKGQVRKWLSRQALLSLLRRNGFTVVRTYTAFPAGDRGFLRLVNSRKVANLLFWGETPAWLTRLKEWLGLGQFRIAVARRDET